jgi:hypothetical protein
MRVIDLRLGLPLASIALVLSQGCGGYLRGPSTKDLAASHEKSEETAKEAAGAVKETAESAASAAQQAVTNPPEAAQQAAEATTEKTKQVALSFGHDMHHWPERVWSDVEDIPSWRTAIVLGAGGALAGISDACCDEKVRHWVKRDPERFGHPENNSLNVAADPMVLFAGTSAVYGTSLLFESPRLHALTIVEPTVFVLKKAFHTTRPNGEADGFPSGHVAGATALATLLGDHFGLYPALAGYTFAGFVAFHRIDYGKHDLSDVIFGAALGYAVGQSVGDTDEELPLIKAHWAPSVGTTRTEPGFSLEWRF